MNYVFAIYTKNGNVYTTTKRTRRDVERLWEPLLGDKIVKIINIGDAHD